jgi:hypothetical protein
MWYPIVKLGPWLRGFITEHIQHTPNAKGLERYFSVFY